MYLYLVTIIPYICYYIGLIGGIRGGMVPTFWPSLTRAGSSHPPHEIDMHKKTAGVGGASWCIL